MIANVVIEPMTNDFIVWRCLHDGPLSPKTINKYPVEHTELLQRYHDRNIPLLSKLIDAYGTCAIVARDADKVVGTLRFYPKAILNPADMFALCLQQDPPYGPSDNFVDMDFPPLDKLKDKTIRVHCMMTGSPKQKDNPYQRKGIGTRMVKKLICWAKEKGWHHIEASAFEDLPIIYEITGGAGIKFWQKLGFYIVERNPFPEIEEYSDFYQTMKTQVIESGIDPEKAKDMITMQMNLR